VSAGQRALAPQVREERLGCRSFDLLRDELAARACERVLLARVTAAELLAGRTVWWINSTSRGGGVAELIRAMAPYWCGSGIAARWLVMEAPAAYFRLTKRIHNLLHGAPARRLEIRDLALFERVSRVVGAQVADLLAPGDVVILEDPQTAGLVQVLRRAGAVVVWRCQVGADRPSEPVEHAWRFLLPFVADADAFVFTRREYIPPGLDRTRTILLAPAIDPVSPKNEMLEPAVAGAILARCGLVYGREHGRLVRVATAAGMVIDVHRRARIVREGAPPRLEKERLVVALARWDRLKDPIGIIHGFTGHVRAAGARLIVAGPATRAVSDDPEGSAVLREVQSAWRALPRSQRRRVDLAALPMADLEENALIVNALQRRAAVIVKKSVQEGFGLGVTEGMWKARPVIATRVGGHQDQIEYGRTGLLIDDPFDLQAFGAAVDDVLAAPAEALTRAAAGREHVRTRFLADRPFVEWTKALSKILAVAGSGR
jgi:trehalose synthase